MMASEAPFRRGICVLGVSVLILALTGLAPFSSVGPVYAQGPQPDGSELLAACGLGQVKSVNTATLTRSSVTMTPGPLFSASGNFTEKPVDTPCDPGRELGPFPVIAGGRLSARIVGTPPVPNTWSLYNSNTSMVISYEPLIGREFGPGQVILNLAGQIENNDLAGEATWPGPGRLRAYIGAPRGSGPLTGSCFGQGYSAQADILEVYPNMPAQPGAVIQPGDRITTDLFGTLTVSLPATGSSLWIGPNSEVTFESQTAGGTPQLELPPYKLGLPDRAREFERAGLPMAQGYYDENEADYWLRYREGTLEEGYNRISKLPDPCEAAVDLKLFLEAHQGQWTSANAGQKAGRMAGDIALTWLLPNEWNVAEKLAEWALRPVPLFGILADAKNVQDTYDRVMKEVVDDATAVRAKRMLTAFESSRGWNPDQVRARQQELEASIAATEASIRQARAALEEGIKKLDRRLQDLNCYDEWQRLNNPNVCAVHVGDYNAAHSQLRYQHHHRVSELMAQILAAQTEKQALQTYRLPLAEGNCSALKQAPPARLTSDACVPKRATLGVGMGRIRIFHNPLFPSQVIDVAGNTIVTRGTELVIDSRDESSTVTVIEGQVEVTTTAGQVLTASAGQQLILPEGALADFDPAADDGGLVSGIPLRELPLDDGLPEPYGTVWADFRDNQVPAGWLWQDTTPNHGRPGDASLDTPAPGLLRVTVPNENDFWGHRDDAPRLLHKVTGDFDLEAELELECEGLHLAISEFLIFVPGRSAGYLKGQFYPEELKSQYLVMGGGWLHMDNLNKLAVNNRKLQDSADPPNGPVRVRMSRRGDVFKTYWSADGGSSWTLSTRETLSLPETMWVGWLFKRMAYDGLSDRPAVTTLREVKLRSGPPGSMLEQPWDLVGFAGSIIPFDAQLVMTHDGVRPGYLQAYSPWSIPGDFDLTVSFDAPPLDIQPGQERYIHVAITSNDEKNHAYVRNALTPDWRRYDVDMAVNGGWYRYHFQDTLDSSGRIRLVRQDGIFSGYYWQDGDWVLLGDWKDGFSDPVYLDLRYQLKSPSPAPQTVTFTIERLVTPEGEWFGPLEAAPALSKEDSHDLTPAPPVTSPGDIISMAPPVEEPVPAQEPVPAACSQPVDPQLAAGWDRERLGCPLAPAETTWAAVQAFERGLMLWRGDTRHIYILFDRGFWLEQPDEWRDGLDIPWQGDPPAGLVAPVRGFGYVWATNNVVFNELGWARWQENGLCALVQPFESGLKIARSQAPDCSGQPNPPESGWFGSVDLFSNGTWR